MSNRIVRVQVRDWSLDPAQAELSVAAEAEHIRPSTELRGRLMGPQCLYSATVEVAYPLRPFLNRVKARVVIPEPCLWEPQCPFLYRGSVELWEDGLRCDQTEVRRGLRRILLRPGGFRLNGRPLFLHGRALCAKAASAVFGPSSTTDMALARLRRDGCNLLMASVDAPSALWEAADTYGFFVLARMRDVSAGSLAEVERQADHPSCLGWLLAPPFDRWTAEFVKRLRLTGALVGAELGEAPAGPLPEGIDFAACPAEIAAHVRALALPLLLLGGGPGVSGVFSRVE